MVCFNLAATNGSESAHSPLLQDWGYAPLGFANGDYGPAPRRRQTYAKHLSESLAA